MKKAYIISTGTELLMGTAIDSNSLFLSDKLSQMGIKVIGKSTVADKRENIKDAFKLGIESADIVISSGGLGPTGDDLTKEAACEIMGCHMQIVKEEVERLCEFFRRRNREMPENNIKQAMFPPEAIIIKNSSGTAPGMYLKKNDRIIILLPGPPGEMRKMYIDEVEPLLIKEIGETHKRTVSRIIKVLGPGESRVEEILSGITEKARDYSLALLASEGEVHIKLTAEGDDSPESRGILDTVSAEISARLAPHIIGYDEQTLASTMGEILLGKKLMLAVAESCTGGLLAQMITEIPGSSRYFWGSVTSYSNDAKINLLKVKRETLEKYGAVSSETAREMVEGIILNSGAGVGIAITGIAGPDGGTENKPVGLVYIAAVADNKLKVKEMKFAGDRNTIRILSAKSALDLARRMILTGGQD